MKSIALRLTVLFSLAANLALSSDQVNAASAYQHPERIMQAFCDYLGEGDFASAAALFDIATPAKMSPIPEASWTRVLNRNAFTFLSGDPSYTKLNEETFRNKSLVQIRLFVSSLLAGEKYPQLANFKPQILFYPHSEIAETDKIIEELSETLNPARMKALKIVRMDQAFPDESAAKMHTMAVDNLKSAFEIDDYGEYSILYEFEGEYYLGGVTVYKYDAKWHIANLFCPLRIEAHKKYNAFIPKITIEEYEGIIAK